MAKDYLEKLEDDVRKAVLEALSNLAEDQNAALSEIQPPTTVLKDAACAATNVFMAFERGFQMVQGE